MIKNLSEHDLLVLNMQQQKIIDAIDKNIMVTASPGSGKTYTLIKRIVKEQEEKIYDHKSFIACSFTKEASKQLEDKLEKEIDIRNSYIGTIDSFVFNEIINPFKNRFLNKYTKENHQITDLKVKIPANSNELNQITKTGKTHYKFDDYMLNWYKTFLNGVYEISFPTYIFAVSMIKKLDVLKEYLKSKYFGVYIDEAQDMNIFQHELINVLKNVVGINIFLIGDVNQSIYSFRGARPEDFENLKNIGYEKYEITISVRCHKSILDYSKAFLKNYKSKNEIDYVYIHERIDKIKLKNIIKDNDSVLWLSTTGDLLKKHKNMSDQNNWNFEYSVPIKFDESIYKEFVEFYENLITELLLFYYNYKSELPEYIYSSEDIRIYLLDYVTEKKYEKIKRFILKVDVEPDEYVNNVFGSIGIKLPTDIKVLIKSSLNKSIHKSYYKLSGNNRRMMTIHGSKGLEADIVIAFVLQSDYWYEIKGLSNEELRKYYVAFTRAKKELHIFFEETDGKYSQKQNNFRRYINSIKARVI